MHSARCHIHIHIGHVRSGRGATLHYIYTALMLPKITKLTKLLFPFGSVSTRCKTPSIYTGSTNKTYKQKKGTTKKKSNSSIYHSSQQIRSLLITESLFRAAGVKLLHALIGEKTPVLLILSLTIVTNAVRLPGLIKGLEVEEIHVPRQHAADTVLPEGLRIIGAGLGSFVVGTTI